MEKLTKAIDGKKTHLIAAAIVVFNALIMAGLVDPDPKHVEAINYILVASGFSTMRVGIKKK